MTGKLELSLRQQIELLPVIDTHEHLEKESRYLRGGVDAFSLFGHYLRADLVAAGMSVRDAYQTLQDRSLPLSERWRLLKPYWPFVRHGQYAQAMLLSLQEVYGFDDFSEDVLEALTEKMRRKARPGFYKQILQQQCRIEAVLNVVTHRVKDVEKPDPDFLHPVPNVFPLVMLRSRSDVHDLEREFGVSLSSFDAFLSFVESTVETYVRLGARGLKFNLAYVRTLRFGRPTRHDAERAFNRLFAHYGEGASQSEMVPFQDYLVRQLVRLATEYSLPVVFHTGFQNDQRHFLEHAHATHLTNLFLDYPDARFVLLHAGFPWVEESLLLSKAFPNVWNSFAWLFILSGDLSERALQFAIETLPVNRVLLFGGDYMIPEKVVGHLRLAQRILAGVLARNVEEGRMSETQAAEVARAWLYENPKRLFLGGEIPGPS